MKLSTTTHLGEHVVTKEIKIDELRNLAGSIKKDKIDKVMNDLMAIVGLI